MIVTYGPNSVVAVSETGYATVLVENDAVYGLQASGDVGCLRAVMRRAEVFCKSGRLMCVVDDSNPLKEKLLKVYAKFGFNRVGIAMSREL